MYNYAVNRELGNEFERRPKIKTKFSEVGRSIQKYNTAVKPSFTVFFYAFRSWNIACSVIQPAPGGRVSGHHRLAGLFLCYSDIPDPFYTVGVRMLQSSSLRLRHCRAALSKRVNKKMRWTTTRRQHG